MILRPANTLFGPTSTRSRLPAKPQQPDTIWKPLAPGAVLLAIDPSIVNCGWALLRQGQPNPTRLDSGVFHPIARPDKDRHDHLVDLLVQRIEMATESGMRPTDALIEIPSGGQRGDRSATQLMVYARAIGDIEATCYRAGLTMHRVTVNGWKGSGRKGHTELVVKHVFKYTPRDNNEADAIGLGLWLCSKIAKG
jgi:Holliday junction resolvasome RuvABC endonuclease subunit